MSTVWKWHQRSNHRRSQHEAFDDQRDGSHRGSDDVAKLAFNRALCFLWTGPVGWVGDEFTLDSILMMFFCSGNDTLHKPNPWEFLISKKHHLVWCNVFKAASTSWMYNFNLLAGYSPQFLKKSQVVPLTLARKKYPRPSVAQVSIN